MIDRSRFLTEQRLPESARLDAMSIGEGLALMNGQDLQAVRAVAQAAPEVERVVKLVADAFGNGGRLFYIGAGTSGRLGVLDASECPPTFRTKPEMVQAIIAGGPTAITSAVEGAEDGAQDGARAIEDRGVTARDVVIGIAAGGTTPYVLGALKRARAIGTKTAFVTCVESFTGQPEVDVTIRLLVGPEVLTGSTRLKAGTATKLVLNQITTLAMVQIGKVYENLMVDLNASNAKLRDRAERIVMELTSLDRPAATHLLEQAGRSLKTAIVMHRLSLDRDAANERLVQHDGHLRQALERE